MLGNALLLFFIVLAGIFISCRLLHYDIDDTRKMAAAMVFAIVNALPFASIITLPISLIALFMLLVDDPHERPQARNVFLLTLLIAGIAILLIYLPQT